MYGYAKLRVSVFGGSAKPIAEKLREVPHQEKHHLVVDLFHEIYSSLGGSLGTTASRPTTIQTPSQVGPELQKFAQRLAAMNLVTPLRSMLDKIEADIDRWTKNSSGLGELIHQSSEARARTLVANKPNIDDFFGLTRAILQSNTSNSTINSVIDGVYSKDSHFVEVFKHFYQFPYASLLFAPYILPHSLTSRYPIVEYDFENLKKYRDNAKPLKGFFGIMNKGVKDLVASVEPFVESTLTLKSLGLFPVR